MSTWTATPSEIIAGNHRWRVTYDMATILFLETPPGPGGLGDLALDLAPLGKVTPVDSGYGARYSIRAPKFEGTLETSIYRPGNASLMLTRPAEQGMITYSTLAGQMCALSTALIAIGLDDMTLVVVVANAAGDVGDALGHKLGGEWGGPPKGEGEAPATAAPGRAPWQTLFGVPVVEPLAGRGSA